MRQTVKAILVIKNKHQHIIYVINNCMIIDTLETGLAVYPDRSRLLEMIDFAGYRVIDMVEKQTNTLGKSQFMHLHFFNCISMGKILFNQKGIFFNCKSFIKALKKGGCNGKIGN